MKILLVVAPKEGEVQEYSTPDLVTYDFTNYPPLGLLAIAAEVDPKHELKVLDCVTENHTLAEAVNYILEFKPDVLGLTFVSRRLFPAYFLSKQIKELMPEVKIIAGGPHANDFPEETFNLGVLDFILTGYAEKTFPQFIEALDQGEKGLPLLEKIPGLYYRANGQIKNNPPDEAPIILDDLPYPKRELLNLERYYTAADFKTMTTVYTSRGCPYKCTFCDVKEKTYHFRSTKNTVDEFEYIASLGINEMVIFDDTFNMGRKRVIEMCQEILDRGLHINWSARVRAHPFDREMLALMKKAGCKRLHVGVESLHPESLKAMKKKITLEHIDNFFLMTNELKLETLAFFIIGFPEETKEYRDIFFDQLKKLKPTYVQFAVLYPLPETQFYFDLLENGVYATDHWAEFNKNPIKSFRAPICRPVELHEELVALVDTCYKKFYLSPEFIIKDLIRTRSAKMLMMKAKLAFKMLFTKKSFHNEHTQQKSKKGLGEIFKFLHRNDGYQMPSDHPRQMS